MSKVGEGHCAKFSDPLLPVARHLLSCVAGLPAGSFVLDPFAGTGKGVDFLADVCGFAALGIELEPEFIKSRYVDAGDALSLPTPKQRWDLDEREEDGSGWDAIFTSPTYGNRMADVDMRESVAGTYAKSLGRRASDGSSCHLQWGPAYREFHEQAWAEAKRVLKPAHPDGGPYFLLNIKDHVRGKETQGVPQWHFETLRALGFVEVKREFITTPGNRHGANGEARVAGEFLWLGELRS